MGNKPSNRLCHYCRRRKGTTIDHIVPKCIGGPNSLWNRVNACPDCNADKGDSWPDHGDCPKCKKAGWKFLHMLGRGYIHQSDRQAENFERVMKRVGA